MISNLLGCVNPYVLIAYLVGSIPTGFLVARARGIRDIREHGSGNIGATNVARMLGTKYFFLIFALDFLKAYVCLWAFSYYGLSQSALICAAVFLLFGNGCSLFLGGRGGKGAATSFGVLLGLHPVLLCYAAPCWFFVLSRTKTVGLATIATLIMVPVCSYFVFQDAGALFHLMVFMCVWGLWLHRENMRRMIAAL